MKKFFSKLGKKKDTLEKDGFFSEATGQKTDPKLTRGEHSQKTCPEQSQRIAVAALGSDLESQVDMRFGRCPYFLIIDLKDGSFEVIKNTAGQAFQGAGISAAQIIANKKIKAIIAGNFGPKAVDVLLASGIDIFAGVSNITIKEALRKYQNNELKALDKNTVSSGPGMGIGGGRGMGGGWGRKRTN